MRNTLAMLCVLATSLAGFSQEKSFNLNHYKFPDYKRHELELEFNSNGTSNKETTKMFTSTGEVQYDYSRYSNNSNLNLGYQYDNLTRKHIDYLFSSLSGRFDYSKNNNYDQKIVQSNPSSHWNLNGFRKYYLIENTFFIEGSTELNVSWLKSKRTATGQPDDNYRIDSQSLSVGLGIGVGRIEKVSDLWQAYYILEKLNKQGSFNRELTEDDVYEFARLASRLKNKRFFDARLQKIEELTRLDSLLHQKGLISKSDISYFTTMNDYWSYGNFQDRRSGIELVFNASPDYQRVYRKSDNNKGSASQKSSIVSNATFTYTKQLNLYWQRAIIANVSYESLMDSTGSDFQNVNDNKVTTNVGLSYGYFPNSRTAIYGGITYQGDQINITTSQNTLEDSWRNQVYSYLSANYYFSPQLQLTGNVYFNYYDKTYSSTDIMNITYNLGLRYAIF